jgi:hypothetical protein
MCVGGTSLLDATSNMPPAFDVSAPTSTTLQSWCNFYSGASRLDGSGHLPSRCKAFLNEHGQNGASSGSTLSAGVEAWLAAARAAMPNNDQWIFYYISPDSFLKGTNSVAVLAGFTAYGGTVTPHTLPFSTTTYYTCSNDPRAAVIDTGAYGAYVTGSVTPPSAGSYGPWGTGGHLHTQGVARLVALIVAAIQAAKSGTGILARITWIEG